MGALCAMIAKTVSRAQELDGHSLTSDFYVAGNIGLENYKSLLGMLDALKKEPGNGKKTVMVLPGVTKAFTTVEQAKTCLSEAQGNLIPIILKVNGTALDVKKLLDDDPASSTPNLPDGLFQRLTAQI